MLQVRGVGVANKRYYYDATIKQREGRIEVRTWCCFRKPKLLCFPFTIILCIYLNVWFVAIENDIFRNL